MNANQVSVAGIILVVLAALTLVLGGVPAYAFESSYHGRAISGADQFDKAIQASGIQLMARSKDRNVQPGAGQVTTGIADSNPGSGGTSQRVLPKGQTLSPFGNPRCWNECAARGITDSATCAQKCGGARPPQRK